jgi:hypothetical protein
MQLQSQTRHSRERGNPDFQHVRMLKTWIPAFAGMTGEMGKV